MKLIDAENLAYELMSEHLSGVEGNWSFQWDDAVQRFGSCDYFTTTITLSKTLTLLNEKHHVVDTILHEIAHALNYERNGRPYITHENDEEDWRQFRNSPISSKPHGKEWKKIARELGCEDTRCYGDDVIQPIGVYTTHCPNCGDTDQAYRKPKGGSACGDCCDKYNNGGYHKKYKLKYVRNKI